MQVKHNISRKVLKGSSQTHTTQTYCESSNDQDKVRETVGEKERNTPTSMDIDRKSPIISQKKKEKRKDTIKVPDTVELFKRATKRQKMTKMKVKEKEE